MRKINFYLLTLVFVFALSGTAVFARTAEGDVFGYFFINGKADKGFTDINYIILGGSGEYGAAAKPPYYGDLVLQDKYKKSFSLLKPALNGKNLSFKTKAVGGISYEFTGVLVKADFTEQPSGDDAEKALSGTLNKLQNGKVIAASKVTFRWEVGD